MATPVQIVFDCADPAALSRFWAKALGYVVQPPPEGFASWEEWAREMNIPEESWNDAGAVVDPDDNLPRIYFQRVPEGKVAKNRVHLDINAGAGLGGEERRKRVEEETQHLISLGAKKLYEMEQRGEFHITMQDPEGNEFCVQ